jgi:hypothetical protein
MPSITHYLTADDRCEALYRMIASHAQPRFQLLPLKISPHTAFGELNLSE